MTHPLTNALAMRTAAAKAMGDYHWQRYADKKDGGKLSSPAVFTSHTHQHVMDAILALPLEADHAALVAEAVKVLRDDIAAQHKRVMSGEQRFYAKNITNACSEMGGPLGNAVERLIAALSALETP